MHLVTDLLDHFHSQPNGALMVTVFSVSSASIHSGKASMNPNYLQRHNRHSMQLPDGV